MMRTPLRASVALAFVATLFLASAASADTYQNDSIETGGTAGFQAGFITGEMGAACFTPPASAYPIRITAVRFFFGGDGDGQSRFINIRIFKGGGGSPPGELITSIDDVEAISSTTELNEIDLTANGITVTEPWCVAIEMTFPGLPSIARDDDGTVDRGNNWIYGIDPLTGTASGWTESQNFLVQGDWIIRTVGNPNGGGGVGPGSDAGGTPDGGGEPDAGGTPDAGGGDVVINSVSPTSGESGEDVNITLSGAGFDNAFTYRIGPQPLEDVVVTGGVTADGFLPAGSLDPGTYDVIVAEGGQILANFQQGFQLRGASGGTPPAIATITPNTAQIGQTTEIVIIGTNFETGATVQVGPRPALQPTVVSDTTISAFVTGDHVDQAGSYDVTVLNPDGLSATLTQAFTVVDAGGGGGGGCSATGGARGAWGLALVALGLAITRRRS